MDDDTDATVITCDSGLLTGWTTHSCCPHCHSLGTMHLLILHGPPARVSLCCSAAHVYLDVVRTRIVDFVTPDDPTPMYAG